MASPPAKRQRRLNVVLSDDDEQPQPQPLRLDSPPRKAALHPTSRSEVASSSKDVKHQQLPNLAQVTSRRSDLRSSPKSSPEKGRGGKKVKDAEKSKSLHTFFNRVTEEQRWTRKATTPAVDIDDGEAGDAIQDDDPHDEALSERIGDDSDNDNKKPLDRRKTPLVRNGSRTAHGVLPVGTQKFITPLRPYQANASGTGETLPALDEVSDRPWSQRYAPLQLDELAIHKKKITDVQRWLEDALSGRNGSKMLVLKGPAGSGKSTIVGLLSKVLDFQSIAWNNPTVSDIGVTNSIVAQFDDFLNRSGLFNSLDLNSQRPETTQDSIAKDSNCLRRALVVDEFPSTMARSSSTLASFRSVLMQYLAAGASSQPTMFDSLNASSHIHPPVVLIISESLLTASSAVADSFTAHRLLGPDVLNHPMVHMIELNPVAPTFVAKALELVLRKEARVSKRRRIPGSAVLRRLSEVGDIRSAVNALQFLCVKAGSRAEWSGTVAAKTKFSAKDGIVLTAMERSSLELVTQREATLGMFHAVGKVVYNKREDPRPSDPDAAPPPQPPNHIAGSERRSVSQVNVDELMNETGTDVSTFIATLHENFSLSCAGGDFVSCFSNCIESLSDCDYLSLERRPSPQGAKNSIGSAGYDFQPGGLDALRQNEIVFQVAVRGLLFYLPYPVHRAAHPGGRKGDSFKMFYPASLRLWKQNEEVDGIVTSYMDRLPGPGRPHPGREQGKDQMSGVGTWKQRNGPVKVCDNDPGLPHMARVLTSRVDMICERLPYVAHIQGKDGYDVGDLSKITQFKGIGVQEEEDLGEDDMIGSVLDLPAADAAADHASKSPQKRRIAALFGQQRGMSSALQTLDTEERLEKLYISEDDIED